MLRQVLRKVVPYMTEKKFAHYYECLPAPVKKAEKTRCLVSSGVAQNKRSKRRGEQRKWARGFHFRVCVQHVFYYFRTEAANVEDVMETLYGDDDDEEEDVEELVASTCKRMGDFRDGKSARNRAKKGATAALKA
jgi:hypothetical protein